MRSQSKLDTVVNVAIIAAAIAFIATQAKSWWNAAPAAQASVRYRAGDMLPDVEAFASPGRSPMLVLFINSECKYCSASMPLYRRLLAERNERHLNLRVVAAAKEDMSSLTQYLKTNGLSPDAAIALPTTTAIKTSSTPTLLLADDQRNITKVWVGALDPEREAELHRALFGN